MKKTSTKSTKKTTQKKATRVKLSLEKIEELFEEKKNAYDELYNRKIKTVDELNKCKEDIKTLNIARITAMLQEKPKWEVLLQKDEFNKEYKYYDQSGYLFYIFDKELNKIGLMPSDTYDTDIKHDQPFIKLFVNKKMIKNSDKIANGLREILPFMKPIDDKHKEYYNIFGSKIIFIEFEESKYYPLVLSIDPVTEYCVLFDHSYFRGFIVDRTFENLKECMEYLCDVATR